MAINKVEYYGNTLVDLTDTTATADKILTGYGAYGADGEWMDGTASGGSTGTLRSVKFNASTSTSTTSTYSDTLDVGEAGNTMSYGGGLFNRASSYTGTLSLYGSQNGSSWTSIRSVTRSSGGQQTFNGTDSTYRYYRVRLQSSSGTNNISASVMLCCISNSSSGTNAINPEEEVI